MRSFTLIYAVFFTLLAGAPLRADGDLDNGFKSMFNGKDLTGWVNVNCAPSTFFVKDGEVITTGKPTGYLRTAKQYENFIAEFDWMHVNKKEVGNSGFFVWADPLPAVGTPYTRGIEVQVLVNLEKEGFYTSQGDLFSIHGATCKPDRPHPQGWARCLPGENRCKGGGEWNHYKVVAQNGTLKLHVNGKEVSGLSQCRPRKGYLALESEGAECHFRNLKIKELPSTHPKPEETAEEAQGFTNLFTGLDLSGWKSGADSKDHWQPRDWILHHDGKGGDLRTDREFGAAEFSVDYRFPKNDDKSRSCGFVFREGKDRKVALYLKAAGTYKLRTAGTEAVFAKGDFKPSGDWNRLRVALQGNKLKVTVNGKILTENSLVGAPDKGAFVLESGEEMDFGNLFVRELKK